MAVSRDDLVNEMHVTVRVDVIWSLNELFPVGFSLEAIRTCWLGASDIAIDTYTVNYLFYVGKCRQIVTNKHTQALILSSFDNDSAGPRTRD